MKERLVSFVAIFLMISLKMMGRAEGKPAPGPQPAPALWWRGFQPAPGSQPAPGPWWSGFRPALHRRRFRQQECHLDWDQYVGWVTVCFEPFGVWNVNYNTRPTPL